MKGEIKALVQAGKVTPASLGQSLGMAGLNIGQVVAKLNSATKQYDGMKVPVKIVYDLKTKDFEVEVSLPPTSQLILKESGVDKGAGDRESMAGDISFDKIVDIAKTKQESLSPDLKKAVIQVLGTCVSVGITVNGKDAREVQQEVRDGDHEF